jgi:type VI secretion system secreted protein Hcp
MVTPHTEIRRPAFRVARLPPPPKGVAVFRTRLAVLLPLALALALPAVAAAANDTFMVIPSVKGESIDTRYKNDIEIKDWSWELKTPPDTGKAAFGDFEFSKAVDTSSAFFFTHEGTGAQIPSIRVVIRRDGTHPLAYLQYCIQDAKVTSYSASGSAEDTKETVSLQPGALAMRYVRQKADGTGLPPVLAGWSVVTQTSIGFDSSCGGTGNS